MIQNQQQEIMEKAKIKEISNIQDLIDFILNNELSQEQIETLLKATINVWILNLYSSKKELVKVIESYWEKHASDELRPLWLDLGDKEFKIDMMYRYEESEYYFDEKLKDRILK